MDVYLNINSLIFVNEESFYKDGVLHFSSIYQLQVEDTSRCITK